MPVDSSVQQLMQWYLTQGYTPLITLQEAAQIAKVKMDTIYLWSSAGFFNPFKFKPGREVRLQLQGFLEFICSKKETK